MAGGRAVVDNPAHGKSGLGRMWAGSQVDTSIPKGVQDSDDDGDRMMGGGTVGQWDGGDKEEGMMGGRYELSNPHSLSC